MFFSGVLVGIILTGVIQVIIAIITATNEKGDDEW